MRRERYGEQPVRANYAHEYNSCLFLAKSIWDRLNTLLNQRPRVVYALDRYIKSKAETAAVGRHSDGQGFTLLAKASGAKSRVLRVQADGKRRDIGLGSYRSLSLADARDKAREYRKEFKLGRDPRTMFEPEKGLTFRAAAEQLIELNKPGWKDAKHIY